MQITAALTYAPDAPFEIQEVELDEPRDDEILVRMVAAGICHTDLGVKASWPADAGPLVLGHEGAGVVEAVGANVSGLAAGDHVLLSYRSCRSCASCTAGHVSYCERFRELNAVGVRPDGSTTMRRDGAAGARQLLRPVELRHARARVREQHRQGRRRPRPRASPRRSAAASRPAPAPCSTCCEPAAGSSFVVFGAGGVGLAGLMAAVHLEVGTAIVVDPVESRRALALELGATHALDPRDGDVVAAIQDLTGGGAGSAFDTTGIPAVIADAARALGRLGALALVGTGEALATLDIKDIIRSGKSVRGVMEGDADPVAFVPQLVELVQQGRLPIDR